MKLTELGIERAVNKGEYLLRAGSRCDHLYWVKEGLLRVYYLKDGREVIDWFGTPGTVLTAMESYHQGSSSDQFIQAIAPSRVHIISREKLERGMETSAELKNEYIELITRHLLRVQQRVKALQFYTAKERYQLLIEKNPEVVKFAPRTQIASYLGISLETLSRVSRQGDYLTNVKV